MLAEALELGRTLYPENTAIPELLTTAAFAIKEILHSDLREQ